MKRLQTTVKKSEGKKNEKMGSKSEKAAKGNFLSLEQSMNDPLMQVFKNERFVCIRDKFPKSRVHLLLIPLGLKLLKVEQVIQLPNRLEFLRDMKKTAGQIFENFVKNDFKDASKIGMKFGFHAVQSMQPLHMHIISQDFDSNCLKNKKHWNSFNTDYFIEIDSLIRHLTEDLENGSKDYFATDKFGLKDRVKLDAFLNAPLKCHKCEHIPKNLPALKKHLTDCHKT